MINLLQVQVLSQKPTYFVTHIGGINYVRVIRNCRFARGHSKCQRFSNVISKITVLSCLFRKLLTPLGKPIPWGKWKTSLHCTADGLDNSIEPLAKIRAVVSWDIPSAKATLVPDSTGFLLMGYPIWDKWANDHDTVQFEMQDPSSQNSWQVWMVWQMAAISDLVFKPK